jgi:hypothetical protein
MCSEYVVSKSVFPLIICFCHIIFILYTITYQLGRIPGKYILFFDKKKSDISNFFLNHKQRGILSII